MRFKNFNQNKKNFNFGKFKKDNSTSQDNEKPNETKGKKTVKNFIQLGKKFRANDRSVENERKNAFIGKIKKHALSANKDDTNLNALEEKPKVIN